MIKIITFIVILVGLGATKLYGLVKEDYKLYTQESACVSKHIMNGVERRDITTKDGECYVNSY